MAIYRGPGGAGDAVADTTNQSEIATTKAAEAASSAAAASTSASSASTSASTASTQANVATNAKADALKLAINAENSLYTLSDGTTVGYSALHYGAKAEDSATSATASATTATQKASDASKLAVYAEDSQYTLSDNSTQGYSALHYNAKAQDAKEDAQKLAINPAGSQFTLSDGVTTGYSALHYQDLASNFEGAQELAEEFFATYLGSSASAPSTSVVGAIYYNTIDEALYIWNGTVWDPAAFSASGAVTSFNTRTGAVTLSSLDITNALTYTPATAAQGALADSAVQPGDNVSDLTNDAGYLTSYTETDPVYVASSWYGTTNNASNWDTAYGWGNHASAGYLTSFTETNDLTAAVTWANVPDAHITQSSVTQHQAALSITEGQISNLGSDIVLDSDIGVSVQGYDADTAKTDTAQTFTASQRGTVVTSNTAPFDMSSGNNFKCTPSVTLNLGFSNLVAGQSGNIYLDNSAGISVSQDTNTVLINATTLAALSTAGVYWLSYYSPDGTKAVVAATGAVV